jgi:uncharacterized protein YfaS (alpha-2-macroglobulin family)
MRAYDEKSKEWAALPFPYQDVDATGILDSIGDDFPRHPLAAQSVYTAGTWLEGKGEYPGALERYRLVVAQWPHSKWVSDARARVQDIEWPWLTLSPTKGRPGEKAGLWLNGRNVKTVSFTAYQVRLEEILLRPEVLSDPKVDWGQFTTLGDPSGLRWGDRQKVAEWTYVTRDTGDHQELSGAIPTPLTKTGAYVVVARSGEVSAATLVVITDLAIVQKTDRDRAVVFVCDAKSGKPVAGAEVVIREIYRQDRADRVSVGRGQANSEGVIGKPLTSGREVGSSRVAALAWVGDRYALTGAQWSDTGRPSRYDEYRGYVNTDRPVYRPGDKVNFRVLILARTIEGGRGTVGAWGVPPELPFEVTVRDPRHELVYRGTMATNEFGTINGSFPVGDEPALGVYLVYVRLTSTDTTVTGIEGNRFRVEEYKKPEFEVKVVPGAEAVRFGEQVGAKVQARYYFGSPVVGAKVAYRVMREPYSPAYQFPRPYDWWVGDLADEGYDHDYYEAEVVKQGEGSTDAAGEVAIELATTEDAKWPGVRAYTYYITAEVTDASRRTIEGKGEVRVSKQQFFAFLDPKRGFYQGGDQIEVEVVTQDVMGRPVAARGAVRVERVQVRGTPDIVEPPTYKAEVQTDKDGRAFFHWTCSQGGQYRFTFEAVDGWKQTVTGRAYVWVAGPDFDTATPHLRGIQLIPETRVYEEGDTCRLLVISAEPDATVLLMQEAGNQVLARAVLPIKGKSRVVEVKLAAGHVPNFRFHAVMVRDWQAYEAEVEIFVPPGQRFLNVSVSSDRAEYRPGDKARFELRATDQRGRPVRAELSLGVVDASVFYIQPDFARDPRMCFYGDRRYTEIALTWSLQWSSGGAARTHRKHESYREHEWVWPEDMGQLQDWPDWAGSYGEGFAGPKLKAERLGRDVWRTPSAQVEAQPAPRSPMAASGRLGARPDAFITFAAPPARGVLGASAEAGPLAEAQVRTQFADTAFWSPAIVTGDDGTASVTVTMPENLTTWKTTVRGVTAEAQVGQAYTECVTTKNLIVRLQAPRFFMERDVVVLSANVHNYLDSEKRAKVTLSLDGGVLELVKEVPADLGLKQPAGDTAVWLTIPKDAEQRVDWVVRVVRAGTASVRMTAQTDEESDAVEMQFPALVHGAEKMVAQSGVMRDIKGAESVAVKLEVPRERRRGATELNLQLTPSPAAIALDALPYLADYPYGCIEQTMSRFLPSALMACTLRDLGVDLDALRRRAEAYEKEATGASGSHGQTDSAYTYPKGMPGSFDAAELSSRMYLRRGHNPVFDAAELDKMVRIGLARIYRQQKSDGGWGWWPEDTSDPYMTAYVCYGLYTAREAGVAIQDTALERGFKFLLDAIKEEDDLHLMAYLASVVTLRGTVDDQVKEIIAERLYRNRMKLAPYSQALLALALKQMGETNKARVMVDNLQNTAHIDRENGTCNWASERQGFWWRWWDNPVETNAAVLRAYLAVRPESDLPPMMVKWMVNNRRGNHWQSTKETAMAVYALADYMRVTKELAPDYTITVDLDGKVQRTYRVNRENALFLDNRFIVGDEVIGDGTQTLTIKVQGAGTLYYSAYLKYFSLEEDLKGAGNEIFVQRRYFRLTPRLVDKQEQGRKWQELTYDREELPSGAHLASGDLIEVELVVDAKNDYEYLVFEDMKPAGCEPVEVRSGAADSSGVYSYIELRDEKAAVFISHMPQGTRAVRYRMRAEIPGEFHALPTNGYSMYAPDVRCLSDEWRAGIGD